MFLPMILAAMSAIAPAQYERAHLVARTVLGERCGDGQERMGIVTARDGALHDLMPDGSTTTSTYDNELLKPLCGRGPLVTYHCHGSRGALSPFPTSARDGRGGDFRFAAEVEYLCGTQVAEMGFAYPVIEHYLIGADGALTGYGIRGEYRDRIRSLARQMVEATTLPAIRIGRGDLPVMGDMSKLKNIFDIGPAIHGFYGLVDAEYDEALQRFATSAREYSPEAFSRTLDPCGGLFVSVPHARERPCTTAEGERISLGGQRYRGWTELTPTNYDAFTKDGRVALAFCDGSGSERALACGPLLQEMAGKLPSCTTLKRGYVDVSRHPELRFRHTDVPQAMALLEGGKRYEVTVPNLSPQMLTLIVCGAESLFGGIAR